MKKIVPFKKDIIFKTNLSEVTSISLEHTLQIETDNRVIGEFIVSGNYKMVETSVNVEGFSFNLPFEVNIDDKYIMDNIIIDIDDFYYEIVNNNTLSINIDVLIDKLVEKPLMEYKVEHEKIDYADDDSVTLKNQIVEEVRGEELEMDSDEREEDDMVKERVSTSLFEQFNSTSETYTTYKVYVVKEGDTLDLIVQNYGVEREELEKYNKLSEINIGDKLIIPTMIHEKN